MILIDGSCMIDFVKRQQSWYRKHTELSGHIIQADVIVDGRVRAIRVAGKEFMTEQTQTLLFPANHFLWLFAIFSVLQEHNSNIKRSEMISFVHSDLSESVYRVLMLGFTCAESTPSRSSVTMHSSFSRFLMSGLAALMSILRFEVGVQGSTERASLPFLGVARGPIVGWFSTDTGYWPNNFFGVFITTWGATKPSS